MEVLVKEKSEEREHASAEEIVTLEEQDRPEHKESGPHSVEERSSEHPRDWGRLGPVRFFYKNMDGSLS